MVPASITLWLQVFLTIGLYTITLWKDNPWFRVCEGIYLGVSIGNVTVIALNTIINRVLIPISQGVWISILPLAFGLMMYLTFIPKYRYMARWGLALITAIGAAQNFRSGMTTFVSYKMVAFVDKMVLAPVSAFDFVTAIAVLISFIGGGWYFVYSFKVRRENPILKHFASAGKVAILWFFGSMLVGSFTSYMTRAIVRIGFILRALGLTA